MMLRQRCVCHYADRLTALWQGPLGLSMDLKVQMRNINGSMGKLFDWSKVLVFQGSLSTLIWSSEVAVENE
jgi:hypothetical protein